MRIDHVLHIDPINIKIQIVGERAATDEALSALTAAVQEALKEIRQMSATQSQLQQEIDALTAATARQTTVVQSAVTYIQGVPALVQKAVQDAIANGVPAEQLQSMNDVINTLSANSDAMQAALIANTSPEPAASMPGGVASIPGTQQP